jgi:hypothetical protein
VHRPSCDHPRVLPASAPVVLVHGGLAEEMDADRFWGRSGITAGLRAAGFAVTAPDRDTAPPSWTAAAAELAGHVAELGPRASIVAGSNGVSVAVRLAVDAPHLVGRLALLWPATAGDPAVDGRVPPAGGHLLDGETLRGVLDAELRGLQVPTALLASDPPNPVHQASTVTRLVELIPGAVRSPIDLPESPRPQFAGRLDELLGALVPFLRG